MSNAQTAMLADIYGRARAAAIATNDVGVSADAEAALAVRGFIKMMKALDNDSWGEYEEDQIL